MVIIIDDYGVSINKHNRSFQIRKKETKRQISPLRVTAIHVRKGCDISSPAILLAAEHEIPVLLFDRKGKVKARLWQTHFGSLAEIRRQQLYWSDKMEGVVWAIDCILRKSAGQRKVLKWLGNRVPVQAESLNKARTAMKEWETKLKKIRQELNEERAINEIDRNTLGERIRTHEGQIGKIYWAGYFDALEKYESADKRTRQPAQDPLNALINYGYGMLYGEVESAVLTAGLDPLMGVLHREYYNRPAFVYDAIEPFRPWVDRLVAQLAINGDMKKGWFKIDGKKVWLRTEGKQCFIPAWYDKMNEPTGYLGKRIKRKDQIQHQISSLAQSLLPKPEEGSR